MIDRDKTMKFRAQKTGEVFDIRTGVERFCYDKDCDTCPMYHRCSDDYCGEWAVDHPLEAARLMGYEVVGETAAERLEASVRKDEDNMETTDKPRICEVLGVEQAMKIITAALQEDKSPGSWYYSWQSNLACTIMDNADIDHDTANKIAVWFLDRLCESKPRFTEEEVAVVRYFMGCYDVPTEDSCIKRLVTEQLYFNWKDMSVFLPVKLFPSIRPGQFITIADIIKNGTVK